MGEGERPNTITRSPVALPTSTVDTRKTRRSNWATRSFGVVRAGERAGRQAPLRPSLVGPDGRENHELRILRGAAVGADAVRDPEEARRAPRLRCSGLLGGREHVFLADTYRAPCRVGRPDQRCSVADSAHSKPPPTRLRRHGRAGAGLPSPGRVPLLDELTTGVDPVRRNSGHLGDAWSVMTALSRRRI